MHIFERMTKELATASREKPNDTRCYPLEYGKGGQNWFTICKSNSNLMPTRTDADIWDSESQIACIRLKD